MALSSTCQWGHREGVVIQTGRSRIEISRLVAPTLLALTGACLGLGAILHLAGAGAAGNTLWIGGGVVGALYSAWTMLDSLRRGRLGVDVIAVLALVGALLVGEYLAASVISLMVTSGRALEAWAAGRARHDLQALLQRAPRTAHRYDGGTLHAIDVSDVVVGDRLMVGSGELVPVDGTLLDDAVVDESALTGEPLPVERSAGEPVRSGVVNGGPPFDVRATSTASESTYAGIVRLVSQAESSQAPFVRLADRYALWFLVVTFGVAAAAWAAGGASRAVAVLVVATPCPLILAAPVALVAGLSRAARRGVIIKGGGVLERLAGCTTVLIDKTGTLTNGRPALAAVVPAATMAPDEILAMAGSRHTCWPTRSFRRQPTKSANSGCPTTSRRSRGRESAVSSTGTGLRSERRRGWALQVPRPGPRQHAEGHASTDH